MRRRKWLLLLPLIPLVLIGGILLLLPLMFNSSSFAFLPQDCPGTRIHITGMVRGIDGAFISVKGTDGFDRALITNADGSFDSGDVSLFAFACELLTITVSAEGFETEQQRYILLDHYTEDALLAFRRDHEPVPVSLEFELEETPND